MRFFRRRQRADETTAAAQSSDTTQSTTLQWEFGLPEDGREKSTGLDTSVYTLHASAVPEFNPGYNSGHRAGNPAVTPLTKPWRTEQNGDVRLEATRAALDRALEEWWSEGQLPTRALLRDGLLTLVAGHNLDEGQRSLLLRTALTYQRGMLTALRYQTDGERTAFMVKEMLLNLQTPFPPALVWRLSQEDEQPEQWVPQLVEELRYELALVEGLQYQQTQTTLDYLEGRKVPQTSELFAGFSAAQLLATEDDESFRPMAAQPYWSYGRLLIIALLGLFVIGAVLTSWQPSTAASGITIPSGLYPLLVAETEQPRLVTLAAFTIDRSEVTNRAYRRCYRAGVCPEPAALASTTRRQYFGEAAFGDFPVVNVSWEAAQAYCAWQGKSLPTAEQWQVAASVAPATRRAARYPWGDYFDLLLANTAASRLGDTQPIGSYDPNGNSGFGLMDMAGNVAEWTASPVTESSQEYIVKGGSFQDPPSATSVTAELAYNRQFYAPWLGFRCSVAEPE